MSGPCFSASVGDHPLRPPTRHRLGRPLPYQLPDGTRTPPEAAPTPFGNRNPLLKRPLTLLSTWGISRPFGLLSPSSGQVIHALLARSPLGAQQVLLLAVLLARLACVRRTASVHPEPGSNSPPEIKALCSAWALESLPGKTLPELAFALPTTLQLSRCFAHLAKPILLAEPHPVKGLEDANSPMPLFPTSAARPSRPAGPGLWRSAPLQLLENFPLLRASSSVVVARRIIRPFARMSRNLPQIGRNSSPPLWPAKAQGGRFGGFAAGTTALPAQRISCRPASAPRRVF